MAAFLPVWAWILIMLSLLLTNFIITVKVFSLPKLHSFMTSMTAILTPSLYPTQSATHITILAKFHIINSITVSGVIVVAAIITNSFTLDSLVWNPVSPLISFNSSDFNTTFSQSNFSDPELGGPQTPVLLTYGVLPPVIVASLLYVLIIVIIMGVIRPSFLELPPSQYSSRRATLSNEKGQGSRESGEEEEKLPVLEEEQEPVKNGFLVTDIEDISDKKTLAHKSENLSRDFLPDIKYLDLLEGKETDLY